jgi:polyisoprenoid-binding protein YceI
MEKDNVKRLALLAGILALTAQLGFAQTSTWVSDPNHSEVDFGISHMSVSKVHGRFGQVKATINYNQTDVTKSTVTATIGVDTIDTGVDQRNAHLKSPDFFDVATMPTATFTSASVAKNGDKLTVTGNLSLHGVTKPVVLDVEGPTTPVTDPKENLHSGFSATTKLNRAAFGIGPKFPGAMVGDEVSLEIDLEVIKQ